MIKNKKSLLLVNYLMVFLLLISGSVAAKAPTAGTIIKNQATATYKDSSGVEQTATSNLVQTVVQQVGSFELVQDQSRYGIAGQTTSFPHVLTNTGNGDDTFALGATDVLAGDSFDFDSIAIYADTNQDGIPDSTTQITSTGVLAAEEDFYFVVVATIPPGATDTQTGDLTVQGTSAFSSTVKTNTDTVTVTDKALVNVTKSISANSGASDSGPYTVTLTYSNPGTVDATDVTLIDALPDGMGYVSGSAEWSLLGTGTVLTDSDKTDAQGTGTQTVIYCAYHADCTALPEAASDADADSTNQITAILATVISGESGTITFDVMIEPNLDVSTLVNVGEFEYNNGTSVVSGQSTNQVPFDIISTPGVVANGSSTSNVDGTDEPVTVTSATLGSTVSFSNIIWNTGNGVDTFDIVVDQGSASFPAGTTFFLYQSDGFTPLLDTNNSSVADTGPMQAGDSYEVVLKAVLPMNGSAVGAAGYDVTKTAISSVDNSVSNSVTDHLDEIVGSSVDMTNQAAIGGAGVSGVGAGPEAAAQTTLTIAPGGSDAFLLYVNNTSAVADSYDLTYSKDNPFVAGTLPAGWTVTFHADGGAGDCSTLGAGISNSAIVAPGGSKLVCAKVSIADGAAFSGAPISVYFQALSQLTGAGDVKHDAVIVGATGNLIFEPDHRAQTEPGNNVVYTHRINNPGNTVFTGVTVSSTDTLVADGWTSVLYEDTDGDGVLSAADQPAGSYTLNPGDTQIIFAKVFAPATAPYGATNMTDIVATGTTNTGTSVVITHAVQDITFVAKSNMSIVKKQAVDANCDGAPDGAFSLAGIQAQPGNCVLYELVATNASLAEARNVRINDAIPEFTNHFTNSGALPTISVGSMVQQPADGGTGLVEGNAGTVNSGASITLIFGVRVE